MATAATIVDDDTPPPSPPPSPAPPANQDDPPPSPAPPADDWRSRIAGDDADLLKYLGRHQSEQAFAKEAKQNLADIRSGKFRKPLGDDPTDDELAAYRKDNGIPEAADGYFEKLSDGLVVGDDDKPYVTSFFEAMHAANAPPAVANAAIGAYYKILEEQSAAEADALAEAKTTSEDALREEWKGDYRRNLTAMHAHLATLPEPVKDAFTHGFGADGVPLGYNAEVLKWLTGLALEANPLATVVPGAGAEQASAIADEIAKIEKVMRENRSAYNRDEKMQARLRELYAAKAKLGGN